MIMTGGNSISIYRKQEFTEDNVEILTEKLSVIFLTW